MTIIKESESTNLYANLNADKFQTLREKVALFEARIVDEDLKKLFHNCFMNTINTTSFMEEDGSVFVLTGDIPAMWLRDSSAQVMQYLFFRKGMSRSVRVRKRRVEKTMAIHND